jgi:hypothetical protein
MQIKGNLYKNVELNLLTCIKGQLLRMADVRLDIANGFNPF